MILVFAPAGVTLEEYVNQLIISLYGPRMSALSN